MSNSPTASVKLERRPFGAWIEFSFWVPWWKDDAAATYAMPVPPQPHELAGLRKHLRARRYHHV